MGSATATPKLCALEPIQLDELVLSVFILKTAVDFLGCDYISRRDAESAEFCRLTVEYPLSSAIA